MAVNRLQTKNKNDGRRTLSKRVCTFAENSYAGPRRPFHPSTVHEICDRVSVSIRSESSSCEAPVDRNSIRLADNRSAVHRQLPEIVVADGVRIELHLEYLAIPGQWPDISSAVKFSFNMRNNGFF